jgi:hypothetical protein
MSEGGEDPPQQEGASGGPRSNPERPPPRLIVTPPSLELIETDEQIIDRLERQVLRLIRDIGRIHVEADAHMLRISKDQTVLAFLALRAAIAP